MTARLAPALALLALAWGCSSTDGPATVDLPSRPGLAVVASDSPVPRTASRLDAALDAAEGVTVVATVNHAQGGGGALRPTQVLLFGNPELGTSLMQINQLAGLDLPQKMLVYEDDNGQTVVAYNSTDYLAARHGVGEAATLATIAEALEGFAQTAAGADQGTQLTPATGVSLGEGVVTVASEFDADDTYRRLRTQIVSNPNLQIAAEVDHQFNAQTVSLQLRPTRLIVFGNPALGTPLMQASQTAGIDLPQKMLVYEDASGTVFVAYNDPAYIAERHGVPASLDEIGQIRSALEQLAASATSAGPQGLSERTGRPAP